MPEKVMTPEEAILSFKCGVIASAADSALGRPHFAAKIRKNAWSLTEELLRSIVEEAIAMGVPAVELELPDKIKACLADPKIGPMMVAYQAEYDARREAARGRTKT